jgi:oligoendopeptidase F
MLNTTQWDNSSIYQGFDDPQIALDIEKCKSEILWLEKKCSLYEQNPNLDEALVQSTQEIYTRYLQISSELATITTFAQSQLSTNSQHDEAKILSNRSSQLSNELTRVFKPLDVFMKLAPSIFIEDFLNHETTQALRFQIHHLRQLSPFLLSTNEEVLANGLSQDGLYAWGKLYQALSSSLKIKVGDETYGLASASNILRESDAHKREQAWLGINQAWSEHEESASALLNAINGWRLEMNKARSQNTKLHYLDVSCHQSRITRQTLETLMQTTFEQKHIGQKALGLMARLMKVDKLRPCDILAPAPLQTSERAIPFDEAMDLIAKAFSEFDPEMGEFALMMAKNNWIDSSPSEYRAAGAYCAGFTRTREPRVFITYNGNMGNVITLAHELGHAYHSWVMRDLDLPESFYSMTLAETASIFAETLVKQALLKKCQTSEERLQILWQDAVSAAALILNIPARFEFEKQLVEARIDRPQSPKEMKKMMSDSWEKWYGDSLTEMDPMFWASKLHFSIAGLGFYNYPYLFGYLFALGIYSQKERFGSEFKDRYISLLRDTGKMSAEDLIRKHLDDDISRPEFWMKSLQIVEDQVAAFENELAKNLYS